MKMVSHREFSPVKINKYEGKECIDFSQRGDLSFAFLVPLIVQIMKEEEVGRTTPPSTSSNLLLFTSKWEEN